ncbi:MAG: hypothetical protein AAF078_07435, partial [Planctomycetota bacterium]
LCEMLLLILARNPDTQRVEVIEDRHTCGLFPEHQWRQWLQDAGLTTLDDHPRLAPTLTPPDTHQEDDEEEDIESPWTLFAATRAD